MASITVNNDIQALSKALSQPPVVKVDSNNSYVESIQEDFDMNLVRSRKLSTFGDHDSFRFEPGQVSDRIWLTLPEKSFDLTYDLTKNVNYASEADQMSDSLIVIQADSPEFREPRQNYLAKRTGTEQNSDFEIRIEILRQAIDQQKKLLVNSALGDDELQIQFQKTSHIKSDNEEKFLKDLTKKLKKVYNHVLVVDEKYEEVEDRKSKENKNQTRLKSDTLDLRRIINPTSYPEDHKLYKEYCSFFKTNTDEMFDHEEMKNELIEEMKVFLQCFFSKLMNFS